MAAPVILALVAVAVWGIPQTDAGSAARWGAWAALALTTAGTVAWLRRR
jgi:LPXTG-motif cell wall-anchored protein